MRYSIIFLLTIFSSLSVIAQSNLLSGTVKYENGKPVADATVVIKSNNRHVLTDEKGRFEFDNVSYGKYEIEVISIEIQQKTFSVRFSENKKHFSLIVVPSEINLNEVVVSTNSIKKEIETKGFAVNVIETQKIAVQSIQTNELLERTAGVKVRQDGGLGSHVHYNINGLSGEAIKVFIDGVPTSNYGPTFSLSSIPPALIERIEVYKGVVPGHLSEDALGGAINIILKQQRKKSLTTSYSYGSFNTHQWNATGNYRWKNGLTFEGSAFYNYSDNNYKVWGDDIYFIDASNENLGKVIESDGKKVKRFHDAYESLGGKFNFGFTNVKWADQFLIGGVLSKDYKEVQNGVTMKRVYGNRHNRRRSNVATLNYSKENLFTKGLFLKVDATHSYLKRQVIDTINTRYDWNGPIIKEDGSYLTYANGAVEANKMKTAEINKDYTNMVRGNLGYHINDNHTFYTNYMFNNFERKISDVYQPSAIQELTNTRDLRKNVLSFTYESLFLSDKLRTNIFYKLYFQKVTSNEPTLQNGDYIINKIHKNVEKDGYGLTLSYAILPNLYLLGSAEEAIRMPSANEIFGNVASEENLVLSSFDLKPEKSINVNLGFNFGTYKINDHSFNLNTSFYYRDTKDMIRNTYTTGNETSSQYKNLESVETKGFDAELNYNYADKVNFRFNVSKFDVLFNTKYGENGDTYSYYRMQICNEPSLKINGNITYFHNDLILKDSKASIYYNISYVNSFLRSWSNVGSKNLDEVPTQYPMDLGLTYTFPKDKIVVSLDAKNILDKQAYDNFGLQKPGRAFYIKMTYFIF